ncbi:uncharacterized protein LOC119733674, partial [Patiria miniata]|uniref:Uncharacterized protein n=1 Tax=Patiria miniata TaxID=46514 RepID=A0A914AG93_PATMI
MHYANAVENDGIDDVNELNQAIAAPEQVGLQDQEDVDMEDVQNIGPPMQIDLRRKVTLFLLKLRELHKVPGTVCSFVASELVNILQMSKAKVHSELDAALLEDGVNRDAIATAMAVIQSTELEDIFHSLEDNRKLSGYVQSEFPYVEPIEFVLGVDIKGKCESTQYIPILKTVELLLQNEDIFAEVVQGHMSEDGKLRDFCDGAFFRENVLFASDSSSLQVELYYDDFNIVNPLGNKVKNYKLVAFYFVLGNLSPQYRSKLHVLQLALLCKSKHLKKYGFKKVLQPLINDLAVLEKDGVCVNKNGHEHHFRGTVSFVSADNLGAHSLGGFNESFNGLRISRFCMATRQELDECLTVESCEMRTRESYNAQVTMVSEDRTLATAYGVKTDCVLNELEYFHVTRGLPSDIAHDLFEGLVPEVLQNLVLYFVSEDYFSLDHFNTRIESFSYGKTDRVNKPTRMASTVADFRVKQTAMQCWCMLRLFPILIGDKVPEHNPQ